MTNRFKLAQHLGHIASSVKVGIDYGSLPLLREHDAQAITAAVAELNKYPERVTGEVANGIVADFCSRVRCAADDGQPTILSPAAAHILIDAILIDGDDIAKRMVNAAIAAADAKRAARAAEDVAGGLEVECQMLSDEVTGVLYQYGALQDEMEQLKVALASAERTNESLLDVVAACDDDIEALQDEVEELDEVIDALEEGAPVIQFVFTDIGGITPEEAQRVALEALSA